MHSHKYGLSATNSYKDADGEGLRLVSSLQELLQKIEDIPEWKPLPEANGGHD